MLDPAAHDLIDRDRLVERLVEMVRIPSVNPLGADVGPGEGESAMADYLAGHLDRLGFVTETHEVAPGRPNVVARSPGGDGTVLALVGHLDTVGVNGYDDPFSGEIRDGRVHGRGACDMKAALAAFLEVATVLHSSDCSLDGRLMVLGLADEEYGMLGSRACARSDVAPDCAIVGEPTSLRICGAHLGQYAFPVRTFGRAAHSSVAETGVNAIEHMVRVLAVIDECQADLDSAPPHPLCGTGRISPTVIRGGDMVAIVPDLCELEVDRRLLPGESSDDVRADLERRLDRLCDSVSDFAYEIGAPLVDCAPLDTPVDSTVVGAARRAAGDRGLLADVSAFPAATDAPNLGVPAVVWGPGALAHAHTLDELVEIDEVVEAAHLYLAVVGRLVA